MTEKKNNQASSLSSVGDIVDFLESNSIYKQFRYNVRSTRIEYQGQNVRFNSICSWFYKNFNQKATRDNLIDAILYFAYQNEYDPFKEHLEGIKSRINDPTKERALTFFIDFTRKILGTDKRLYVEYIKCFAIGAVARTYDSGCKHDDALILCGRQGIGKSTFFRVLFGDEFFSDRLQGDLSNKDQIMLLLQFVCLEWSELDKQFKRDRLDSIKAAMRSQYDDYRPPYGKDIERVPRRCVLVGTTNEQEILADKTGNRTFHVIPINCTIDSARILTLRETFWRCAMSLYEAGEPHHLADPELREAQRIDVGQFETHDPWFDVVEKYVTAKLAANPNDWFLPKDFLVEQSSNDATPTKILREFEDARNDRASEMRLGKILRQLGLESKMIRKDGELFRAWVKQGLK
jgi:predicted P-loop ATPase